LNGAGSLGRCKKTRTARHRLLMILSDLAALCFAAACPSVRLALRLR